MQSITTAECQLMQLTTMNERCLNQPGPKRCLALTIAAIIIFAILWFSSSREEVGTYEARSRLTSDLL